MALLSLMGAILRQARSRSLPGEMPGSRGDRARPGHRGTLSPWPGARPCLSPTWRARTDLLRSSSPSPSTARRTCAPSSPASSAWEVRPWSWPRAMSGASPWWGVPTWPTPTARPGPTATTSPAPPWTAWRRSGRARARERLEALLELQPTALACARAGICLLRGRVAGGRARNAIAPKRELGWRLRGLNPGRLGWQAALFALCSVARTDSAAEATIEATNQVGDTDSMALWRARAEHALSNLGFDSLEGRVASQDPRSVAVVARLAAMTGSSVRLTPGWRARPREAGRHALLNPARIF